MADLETIREGLEYLARREPSLPSRFPALFAFFAYRTDAAQRGADLRTERRMQKAGDNKEGTEKK